MVETIRHCPDCGSDRSFEQYHAAPSHCPDTPDGYCPEWLCTACGAALLISLISFACDPVDIAELHGRVA
jgi:hypothetical protein